MPPTDEITVRRAVPADSDRLADLVWRVRRQSAETGSIPPSLHLPHDLRTWMNQRVLPRQEVWVALDEDRYVGVLVLARPDRLEHIYVDASHTGHGLGSRLVGLAKRELGGDVQLWTFQSNHGAQRFYEQHGFVAVETTDGDNEEGEPDVRYLFRP